MATTTATKLQPLADRVVVQPIEEEETMKGGLYIPDTAKEKPQQGEVIAVGPGKLLEDGSRGELEVSVGDKVLYSKYGGQDFTVGGDELLILKESDIYAIVK